jgi:hypothetical protein
MENIISEFKNSFENLIQDFKLAITNEYDIQITDLDQIWNKLNQKKHQVEINKKIDEKEKSDKKGKKIDEKEKSDKKGKKIDKEIIQELEPESDNEKDLEKRYCSYVLRRGEREGRECGELVKNINCTYCTQHKKYEGKEIKDKNIIPTKKSSPAVKSSPDPDRLLRIIPKTDIIYNPLTQLVFKSKDEKIVIGKWNKENKCVDNLTEEDVKICIAKKFAYKQPEKNNDDEEKINELLLQWDFEDNHINGKISYENLNQIIKPKKIKKSTEYENDGYPIKISHNKDDEKLILEYKDGSNKWVILSLTIKNFDHKYLYKYLAVNYINNIKSKENEFSTNDKKKNDNLSKKLKSKKSPFNEEDNVEDVLKEIIKPNKNDEILDSSDEESDLLDD